MSGKRSRFGLLGRGISYSLSPQIWQEIWAEEGREGLTFELIDCPDVAPFLQRFRKDPQWGGVMVTTPYKEAVLPFLDSLSPEAEGVGAVNAIAKEGDRLVGYNTDVGGFLAPLRGRTSEGKALVLGSGGASKAVVYALRSIGMEVQVVSRSRGGGAIGYEEVTPSLLQEVALLVNATPLGGPKYPTVFPPIPWERLGEAHTVYDLSYLPPFGVLAITPEGPPKIDGRQMLRHQAELANQIFHTTM